MEFSRAKIWNLAWLVPPIGDKKHPLSAHVLVCPWMSSGMSPCILWNKANASYLLVSPWLLG